MTTHAPIDDLTPEQRLQSLAAILAHGVLRLRQQQATSVDSPKPPKSPSTSLDVSRDSRLSGPTG